jgi:hypothetical protein
MGDGTGHLAVPPRQRRLAEGRLATAVSPTMGPEKGLPAPSLRLNPIRIEQRRHSNFSEFGPENPLTDYAAAAE